MLLARSLSGKETPRQVERAAVELHVACRLSESLGCEAVRCMEAVARTYRRGAAMQDMKHGAAAMPQATAQLLCALPACTVLLGELFGAGPLGFLFGSPQGLMCLVSGGGAYACGLLWMRGLLRGVDQERFSMAMPGGER